jgi:uncharacterized protein
MKRRKIFKRITWLIFSIFLLMNIVAFFHAYKFTHFSLTTEAKTQSQKLSFGGKLKALFFGINNPRPENKTNPKRPYETVVLQSNKKIECWYINTDSAKGTVILFHGYGGEKSSMLRQADEFLALGYNTLLVDFMGSGGSEGNQTTIGFKEAEEVKSCYDYISKGEKNIYLFGSSLGASAILKSINDYAITLSGIIIECPFGSLYKTTCARFKSMGVPSFPMSGLLVFWGGVQNGFWAFSYKPEEYAKKVTCPALLLYGEKDERVSRKEIDIIFTNMKGKKYLKTFPLAGHEDYHAKYKDEWMKQVIMFLDKSKE